LSDGFVRAISAADVAPGGMKAVELDGQEVIVCNCGGKFYAIQRRCGHMNAPLDLGTLDGPYLTCPMHCAQFDVSSGEALSGPVPAEFGDEVVPARLGKFLQDVGMMMQHVRTESIRTYATKVEAGWVQIALKSTQ
jgi:nitrite reductase/ring-hydroxylating ferredoxin subunit